MWTPNFFAKIKSDPKALDAAIYYCKNILEGLEASAENSAERLNAAREAGAAAQMYRKLSKLNSEMSKTLPKLKKCYRYSYRQRNAIACMRNVGERCSKKIDQYLQHFSD